VGQGAALAGGAPRSGPGKLQNKQPICSKYPSFPDTHFEIHAHSSWSRYVVQIEVKSSRISQVKKKVQFCKNKNEKGSTSTPPPMFLKILELCGSGMEKYPRPKLDVEIYL